MRSTRRTRVRILSGMLLAGVLLLVSSCIIIVPEEDTGTLKVTVDPTGRGLFASLPEGIPLEAASPTSYESALERTGVSESTARAWARTDKVLYEIYSGSTVKKSVWDTTINTAITPSGTSLGWVNLSGVPAGSYTGVKVSVYNTAVDTTNPVSVGWSAGFSILKGVRTDVTATCTPVSMTSLVANSWSSTFTLSPKAEHWFYATTPISPNTFSIDRISGSMEMHVFDFEGNYRGSRRPIDATDFITVSDTGSGSDNYFVVLYNASASYSGQGAVKYRGGVEP